MRETGRDFAEVLAEAQQLGYAEADPSFDVDGIDAAHKLADPDRRSPSAPGRFRRRAYRGHPPRLAPWTSQFAEELGYRIKLLGIARADALRHRAARASLHGAARRADRAGRGRVQRRGGRGRLRRPHRVRGPRRRGRGRPPRRSSPTWSTSRAAAACRPSACRPRGSPTAAGRRRWSGTSGAYYMRLMVLDRPGVIADVAARCATSTSRWNRCCSAAAAPGEACRSC